MPSSPSFAERVVAWQRAHGRHDLPWQNTRDAYRIWLSEIMLQQTQVAAVVRYYERFLERFAGVRTLAAASIDEVMALWSGLGYYSRARNLHACAIRVVETYGGEFPRDPEVLETLPGIGRSTAAAIAVFAHGECAAILDGNVKRVFARHWAIDGWPGEAKIEAEMWKRAEAELPNTGFEAYTQGLMDLGATVCVRTRPLCAICPIASTCLALAGGRVQQLPIPKPRKTVPSRDAYMLVALHDGEVLLEKRRAPGIWGGLWSLPQFDDRAELELALATIAPDARGEMLASRKHGFTHFTLNFTPLVARLSAKPAIAAQTDRSSWVLMSALERTALPSPVRRLLEDIAGHATR